MPIAGEVIEFNEALEADPELVNNDPYGDGWMIKVKMSDVTELENLLSDEAYSNLIQ
jgi:glycine cleavage system H protein